MNYSGLLAIVGTFLVCLAGPATARADQTVSEQLSILDERLSKLRADVDALQFNQQQIQQDVKQVQAQLEELRRTGPSASANDIQALDARIRALDAARETDKKVILDQLAKELAALGSPRSGGSVAASPSTAAAGNEHIVQKGETLTSIAKLHGLSVTELKKANNLTSDEIRVGQKLVLPK